MKKITCGVALFALSLNMYSQYREKLEEYYLSEDKKVTSSEDLIVTPRAMNYFMAIKIGSFLASEGDLSLKKNYATVNTDGGFSFGYNFTNNLGKKTNRVKWIFTPGIKTDYEDDFASFIDEGTKSDVHVTLKCTWFYRGTLGFDKTLQYQPMTVSDPDKDAAQAKSVYVLHQKDTMEFERSYLIQNLLNNFDDEAEAYESANSKVKPKKEIISSIQKAKKEEFSEDLLAEYKKKLHEKESEILKEKKQYTYVRARWISFVVDAPIWNSTYQVADSFLLTDPSNFGFKENKYYNLDASLSYNILQEGAAGKLFFSFSPTFRMTNNVATKQLKTVDYNTFKSLGGTDTMAIAQFDSEKRYLGKFKEYFSPVMNAQFVYYFRKFENIGLRASIEQYIGPDYHPTNLIFGIPIKFVGKEDDEWVNIELQTRFNDTGWSVDNEAKLEDRIAIGFTVGVPFRSIIY